MDVDTLTCRELHVLGAAIQHRSAGAQKYAHNIRFVSTSNNVCFTMTTITGSSSQITTNDLLAGAFSGKHMVVTSGAYYDSSNSVWYTFNTIYIVSNTVFQIRDLTSSYSTASNTSLDYRSWAGWTPSLPQTASVSRTFNFNSDSSLTITDVVYTIS